MTVREWVAGAARTTTIFLPAIGRRRTDLRAAMLSAAKEGVLIAVQVVPRAARSGIAGTRGDALLVRLNAAPVDGAANAELIEVIADAVGVARRTVSISTGGKSRRKTVYVSGISVDEVRARLVRPG